MAPRDLDDDEVLTAGAAEESAARGPAEAAAKQTDGVPSTSFESNFDEMQAANEEARYGGGTYVVEIDGDLDDEVDETGSAQLHTHATVDNRVEDVRVILSGDVDEVVAALDAVDALADDHAAALRTEFHDRAAATMVSRADDASEDIGYDTAGFTDGLDHDRDLDQDVDQEMAAGQGMAT